MRRPAPATNEGPPRRALVERRRFRSPATRCSRTPPGSPGRRRPAFSLSMSTRALSSCITSSVRFSWTFSIVSPKSGPASSTASWLATKITLPAGQHALVVLEDRVLVGREQLRVGREQDREVGVALVEHLVAQADVDRRELLELEPVVLLEADQAVDPLAALGRAVEGQVLRLALEVGDRRDAELVGRRRSACRPRWRSRTASAGRRPGRAPRSRPATAS